MQEQAKKQKRYFSHLNWNRRLKIEQMCNDGRKPKEIADALHYQGSQRKVGRKNRPRVPWAAGTIINDPRGNCHNGSRP